MSKKFFSLALCLFISIGAAFAQTRQVSGTVTDATTGDPVVGAAVQLKGSTTRYSMTDALGNYSISVPADATLTVSMFGYLGVDVPVEGKTVVISGSGNVAIYATQKATQYGAKVVALSDSNGYIHDPDGIELDVVKQIKEVERKRIKEYLNRTSHKNVTYTEGCSGI